MRYLEYWKHVFSCFFHVPQLQIPKAYSQASHYNLANQICTSWMSIIFQNRILSQWISVCAKSSKSVRLTIFHYLLTGSYTIGTNIFPPSPSPFHHLHHGRSNAFNSFPCWSWQGNFLDQPNRFGKRICLNLKTKGGEALKTTTDGKLMVYIPFFFVGRLIQVKKNTKFVSRRDS